MQHELVPFPLPLDPDLDDEFTRAIRAFWRGPVGRRLIRNRFSGATTATLYMIAGRRVQDVYLPPET